MPKCPKCAKEVYFGEPPPPNPEPHAQVPQVREGGEPPQPRPNAMPRAACGSLDWGDLVRPLRGGGAGDPGNRPGSRRCSPVRGRLLCNRDPRVG